MTPLSRPRRVILVPAPLPSAKCLKSGRLKRAGLAGRLLPKAAARWGWWVLSAICFSGCLFPQDEGSSGELPGQFNRPPWIDPVRPSGIYYELDDEACDPADFSAQVSDLDLEDVIRVNWFVTPIPPPTPAPGPVEELIPGDSLTVARATQASLLVNRTSPGELLGTPGDYLVELLVADGELRGRTPIQPPPNDNGFQDRRYVDTHAWFVRVNVRCSP